MLRNFEGKIFLLQILDPSLKIDDDYRTVQFLLTDGRVVSGVVASETPETYTIRPNLLMPEKDQTNTEKRR